MWIYTLLPQILNMSFTASVVILIVLLARLLLKKAPKIFSYALWGVVLFRLICPVSLPSSLSLLNIFNMPATTTGSIEYIPVDFAHTEAPEVDFLLPGASGPVENPPQGAEQGSAPLESLLAVTTFIWFAGMTVLLLYSVVSLLRLRQKLVGAVRLRDNIYFADHISSPFVLGLFRPKIYLPSSLSEKETRYILLHEQTHIRRLDHVIKLAAFAALCLHWFNPLVWIAFLLAIKDMEMSCDESVIRKLGGDIKPDYSSSLLNLSTNKNIIGGTPLAFGEGNVKERIRNVLSYKKPAFWILIVIALLLVTLAVSLLVNPIAEINTFTVTAVQDGITTNCEYLFFSKDTDTLEQLAALEDTWGLTFQAGYTAHQYVELRFSGQTPEDIYLRHIAENAWQEEYPIDGASHRFLVPEEPGVHNFFADITWPDGTQKTAGFCVTVTENTGNTPISEASSETGDTSAPELTVEAAEQFIRSTLQTLTLQTDGSLSFKLPDVIPANPAANSQLQISLSATYLVEAGTYRYDQLLDNETNWSGGQHYSVSLTGAEAGTYQQDQLLNDETSWSGGQHYSVPLPSAEGELTRIMLRVAFILPQSETSYQVYAADYIELTAPFHYGAPTTVVNPSAEITANGQSASILYKMRNGNAFALSLSLPDGLSLSDTANHPEYEDKSAILPPLLLIGQDGNLIGTLCMYNYGATDAETLAQVAPSSASLPMAIYSPVALSNHADYSNGYTVVSSSGTASSAVSRMLYQDLSESDAYGSAANLPWYEMDCVMAFDLESEPCFLLITLSPDAVPADQLSTLAQSIVFAS